MEKFTSRQSTLDQDRGLFEFYSEHAKKFENTNPGLSNHFSILGLETILQGRKDCSLEERQLRETLAASVMERAKSLKHQLRNKVDMALKDEINKRMYENMVNDANNVKFEDITGLDEAKQIIYESMIFPSRRPDIFTGIRAPAKGILMYGPPGNGKTMIAKAIANEAKFKFFNLSAASLLSKFVGESEKLIKSLFYMAKLVQPSVIFIDEIDSILSKRSSEESDHVRKVKNEFLIQFEGMGSSGQDWVFVIAATNRPYDIDSAVLRRFPKKILIDVPTRQGIIGILQKQFKGVKTNLSSKDYEAAAKLLDGYSSSDLVNLCKEAVMIPLRSKQTSILTMSVLEIPPVELSHIKEAKKQVPPCASAEEIDLLRRWGSD